jgi:hypothetical protein
MQYGCVLHHIDPKLSQYVKFPGIYIDTRKRDMIPSRLLRAKQKTPAYAEA